MNSIMTIQRIIVGITTFQLKWNHKAKITPIKQSTLNNSRIVVTHIG